MSLQAQLDNEALNLLPKIKSLITESNRNEMIVLTIRECLNCTPPVSEMSESQKDNFQNRLIESFKYKQII